MTRPPAEGRDHDSPEREAVMADSVGLALLVVLETLAPAERLAFVLHDMFAVPFAAKSGPGAFLAVVAALAGIPVSYFLARRRGDA